MAAGRGTDALMCPSLIKGPESYFQGVFCPLKDRLLISVMSCDLSGMENLDFACLPKLSLWQPALRLLRAAELVAEILYAPSAKLTVVTWRIPAPILLERIGAIASFACRPCHESHRRTPRDLCGGSLKGSCRDSTRVLIESIGPRETPSGLAGVRDG